MTNRTHGTGSITQRSEGTWSLRYYAPGEDGKYRQVRETVKGSQAKAEKELRARLSNLDQGAYVDKKKLAVRPFLAASWLNMPVIRLSRPNKAISS